MAGSSPRDPRRSLIIGSVIAGVILLGLAVMVMVGVYLVFEPRRGDRDSAGRPPTVVAFAPIHRMATPSS